MRQTQNTSRALRRRHSPSFTLKSCDWQGFGANTSPVLYFSVLRPNFQDRETLTYPYGVGFLPHHQPWPGVQGSRVQTWSMKAFLSFMTCPGKGCSAWMILKLLWVWLSIFSAEEIHWDMWPTGFKKCIFVLIDNGDIVLTDTIQRTRRSSYVPSDRWTIIFEV